MKIIVGLGNPGRRYQGTRHNLGYDVLAELARRHSGGARPRARFDGELLEVQIGGAAALLLSPLTYMNLSGRCVGQVVDFYKLPLEDLLVVCDDFQLPLGRMRVRGEGSAGGQLGLQSILDRLGTTAIPRLRIGIGPVPEGWDPAQFVLGRFLEEQRPVVERAVRRGADAAERWLIEGLGAAMNRFNGPEGDAGPVENGPKKENKKRV